MFWNSEHVIVLTSLFNSRSREFHLKCISIHSKSTKSNSQLTLCSNLPRKSYGNRFSMSQTYPVPFDHHHMIYCMSHGPPQNSSTDVVKYPPIKFAPRALYATEIGSYISLLMLNNLALRIDLEIFSQKVKHVPSR